MPKIVFVRASERQEYRQSVPEEQHSRTNAALSDIFAACGVTLRVFVTVVAFPPPTSRAEPPTSWWPHELRTAA